MECAQEVVADFSGAVESDGSFGRTPGQGGRGWSWLPRNLCKKDVGVPEFLLAGRKTGNEQGQNLAA